MINQRAIKSLISNAYYLERDSGGTMTTAAELAARQVVAYLNRQRKIDDHYVPRHGDVLRCESPSGPTRPAISTVAVYRDYAGDGVGAYWACDGTEIHEEQETVLAEAVEILYRRPS